MLLSLRPVMCMVILDQWNALDPACTARFLLVIRSTDASCNNGPVVIAVFMEHVYSMCVISIQVPSCCIKML